MESKESQPHPERSKRGGYVLRPGANPHRAAPGNTVTKNRQILAAFVPEKYESVHNGEPPGAAGHRCASESQRWERASARSKSLGSGVRSSNFLMRGSARVAARAPASMASLARSKSSHARCCTSGRKTKSAW